MYKGVPFEKCVFCVTIFSTSVVKLFLFWKTILNFRYCRKVLDLDVAFLRVALLMPKSVCAPPKN